MQKILENNQTSEESV